MCSALYNLVCFFSIEDLNTQTLIAASNGRKVPALTIFTYALQYFKDHALRELSDQSGTRFVNEDVRWVITVPAIWKQSAKQFMREAAYQVWHYKPIEY